VCVLKVKQRSNMKVIINSCYGGYGISETALQRYNATTLNPVTHEYDISRTDPILIKIIEELGDEANSQYSKLRIVEIPDNTDYTIENYDGLEHIAEVHKTWY